jgi:hypothetical protein
MGLTWDHGIFTRAMAMDETEIEVIWPTCGGALAS